jgi:septal ring factor EnvC (AmiA/AmiB activator)
MKEPKKMKNEEHDFCHHPFRRSHKFPMMGKPFMFKKFGHGPFKMMLDDIESKEEAIELLEIQIKRTNKHRKHLEKRIARMDEIEESIEEAIGEIGKMKEFSKDEMKKILKKKYREFVNKMLDDE